MKKEKQSLTNIIIETVFICWQRSSWIFGLIFPLLGSKGNCRFLPTCSEYSRQALKQYGMIQGVKLTLKRLGRCHPFNRGGYDPVKENA